MTGVQQVPTPLLPDIQRELDEYAKNLTHIHQRHMQLINQAGGIDRFYWKYSNLQDLRDAYKQTSILDTIESANSIRLGLDKLAPKVQDQQLKQRVQDLRITASKLSTKGFHDLYMLEMNHMKNFQP